MLSDHIVMFSVEFLPDCSIWIQATLQCSVLVAVFSIDTGNITVFSSCCSALIAATLQCSVLVYIVQYLIEATLQCSVLVYIVQYRQRPHYNVPCLFTVYSINGGHITMFRACLHCTILTEATLQCSMLVYIVQY